MLNHIEWKGGITDEYFYWLCSKVGFDEDHEELLRYLFGVEFTWILYMDKNRSMDGIALRDRFKYEENIRGDAFEDAPCSVLEALVALSVRIEDDVMGDPDLCVFWRMLEALGVLYRGDWDDILEKWLNRTFEYNGKGSIFVIRRPYKDQRDIEIWEQCMCWLNEVCELV